jgi:transglutaminase-like putative cysteine protease
VIYQSPQSKIDPNILYWLIGAVLLAALPHSLHLPLWASILFVFAATARIPLHGYQRRGWMRMIIAGLGLAGGLGIYLHFGTFVGRDPSIALLVIAVGLKVLESYRFRDAMVLVLLTYFVVATHFFYTQGIPDTLYMFGVVVLTTMVMIQLNQGGESLGWVSRLRRVGAMLLQSVPMMLVLFILFPRINGPLWSTAKGSIGVTGLDDRMAPGMISQLVQSNEVVFRVSFHDAPPPRVQLYWRGPVLSDFDGRTWLAHEHPGPVPRTSYAASPIAYDVVLEPHNKTWLFALDLVHTIPLESYLSSNYQLLARNTVNDRRRYRVVSSTDYTLGRSLSSRARQHYLALPEALSPRVRALTQKWRAIQRDAQGISEQALAFFRDQPFVYTLTPPLLSGDHTDQFLFETQSGFCEHYASSFTVLMRASGVPARVVTGYQGGEWNPMGRYMLVHQSDAHAWAEIWIEGRGWVRIDPTAAVSPNRVELGINNVSEIRDVLRTMSGINTFSHWLNHFRLAWDTINFHWDEWVVAFGPQRQQALLSSLGFKDTGWQLMALLLIISMTAIIILYSLIMIWRHRVPRPDPVTRLYLRFGRKMITARLEQWDHEGAADYADRVAKLRPELAVRVGRITELYNMLRYGRHSCDRYLAEMKQLIRSLRI